MKRVHLFLTMLLLAIGVPLTQAQVYYTGSFTNPVWSAASAQQATKGSNCYYFQVPKDAQFKVSKVKADWDSGFNGNLIYPSANGAAFDITTEAVKTNSSNTDLVVIKAGYICISLDYQYIQLCADPADFKIPGGGDDPQPTGPQLYAVGNFNNVEKWVPEDPVIGTATESPAGWYITVTEGDQFKVSSKKGDWNTFNSGARKPSTNRKVLKETTVAQPTAIDGGDPNLVAPKDGYVWVSEDYEYIQFVTDLSKISLTGDEPTPDVKKSYTIYFYNSPSATKKLTNPYVHMWDADGSSYKGWNDDAEKLTSTGKYYNVDGVYCEVWKYEVVNTTLDITCLKFHNNGNDSDCPEYKSEVFEDGKAYIYNLEIGRDKAQNRVLVDKPAEAKVYTIYFYNATQVGATPVLNAPKVLLTTANGEPYKPLNDSQASMTATGRFYKINGYYYPVWKYTVSATKDYKNIRFYDNDNTSGEPIGNQTFEHGKDYIYYIKKLSSNQNRVLEDKPATPSNLKVYIVTACDDFCGPWQISSKFAFAGPDANGFFRFTHTQMEAGEDHAFKVVARRTNSDNSTTDTWIGFHGDDSNVSNDGVTGGNALTEGKVKFDGNDNIYFTETPRQVNIIYSPVDGRLSIDADFTNDDPVEDADDDVYLYFHTKYDLQRKSVDGAVPYCHVYNDTSKFAFTDWESEDEKMERVVVKNHGKKGNDVDFTEKYTLWRFKVPKEHVNGVDNVMFYFPTRPNEKGESEFVRYDSHRFFEAWHSDENRGLVNDGANRNDLENWTKYIYTTAAINENGTDLEYAQQTFLTFDDFLTLDRKCVVRGGREAIYFIGGGEGMATDITGPLTTCDNEDGCFYLPTKGSGKWFKVSWIEPDHFEYGSFDTQRYWSTFDFGLVAPNVNDDQYDGEDGNGTIKLNGNRSVLYENYNQADWNLPERDDDFYIVVDSHDACHSVTVLFVDPQPELKLQYDNVRTVLLNDAQAKTLHANSTAHLNDLATPDDAPMVSRVNIATGVVEIKGLDNVDTENHSMRYVLTANGTEAGRFPDAGRYMMDYMPIAGADDSDDVQVRAVFEDRATGYKFHSRISKVEMEGTSALVPPTATDAYGTYVVTRIGSRGYEYCCINVPNITYDMPATDLEYYPDFTFDDATLNYAGHSADTFNQTHGNKLDGKDAFVDYGSHWSEKILSDGKFGLQIHRERRADQLIDETSEGEIHAVYPFLINPDAEFVKLETNGPAMAAAADDNLDVSNLNLAMMPASAKVRVTTLKNSFITTAIETVGVDGDDTVEYFNLQGIRILNPIPGEFYLRHQGNVTEKIRY